jgi:acetyl esterase/lipase
MNLTHCPPPARRRRRTPVLLAGVLAAAAGGWVPAAGPAPAPPDRTFAVQVVRNVRYYDGADADDHQHRLDLYLPQGHKDFPVLVFVHGGGWSRGDKNELGIYYALGQCFARQGIALVCPNYRLSPTVRHPEHVRDVARAFAWISRNIARYGGRPGELFIGGHSAGGHLAALLAADDTHLKAEGLTLRDVRGAVAMSGLFTIPDPVKAGAAPPVDGVVKKNSFPTELGYGLFSAVFGNDPQVRRQASPMTHVRPGLPPFLILCADNDLPFCDRPGAEAFCQALRAKQCDADFCEMRRRNHVSILWNATYDTDPATRAMISFMLSQVVLDRLALEGGAAIDFLQGALRRYAGSPAR